LKIKIALQKQKFEKLNQLNAQDNPINQAFDNNEDWI